MSDDIELAIVNKDGELVNKGPDHSADEVDTADDSVQSKYDGTLLAEMVQHTYKLKDVLTSIQALIETGHFQHLSKEARNQLFDEMQTAAADIKDCAHPLREHLKRNVKRVRVDEAVIDSLIMKSLESIW